MAGPGAALSKSEPTVEDLDRFASEIKASWDLDDAPFAAGPAPTAADLAVLQPLPMEQEAQLQKLEPPAKSISAPPAPMAPAPFAPAPPQRPVQAVPAAQPVPSFAMAPRPAPSVGSLSDLTGSFVVPKKRTGLWVAIAVVALAGIGGVVLLRSPDAPPPTTTKVAEPQTPRDNPIPPPPPVDELPAPKVDKPSGKVDPKPEPVAVKTPEPPAAAKPEPKIAPRAPEPKPQPRAVAPKPPAPPAAHPPAPKPPAPTPKSGGGGIVRDVPF